MEGLGVDEDIPLACYLFTLAAEFGNESAKENLKQLRTWMTASELSKADKLLQDYRKQKR